MLKKILVAVAASVVACTPPGRSNAPPQQAPPPGHAGGYQQPYPQQPYPQQPAPQPAPQQPPQVFNPLSWIPILFQPFPMPAPAGTGAPPPTGTTAPPGPGPAPAGVTPAEAEVLTLVNQHRQQGAVCGSKPFGPAPPLVHHAALHRAARAHSQDMASRNYFDHTSLDGRTVGDRLRAAGYSGGGYGENIAAGNETAQATVAQWMRSPGHCENIMDPHFRTLGVGYAFGPNSSYGHYWTQNFGG